MNSRCQKTGKMKIRDELDRETYLEYGEPPDQEVEIEDVEDVWRDISAK